MFTLIKALAGYAIVIGSSILLIFSGHPSHSVSHKNQTISKNSNLSLTITPTIEDKAKNVIVNTPVVYKNYGWYTHNGQSMQYVNGQWYSQAQQAITSTPTVGTSLTTSTTAQTQILMPNNPYIDTLCDNLGNCVHSQFANKQNSSYQSSFPTIHVGTTLTFNVKVINPTNEPVLADFFPYNGKGEQTWSNNLTYTKTFTTDDINTSQYYVNVYIKAQNGNVYRLSGCYNGACDDYTGLSYIVLP